MDWLACNVSISRDDLRRLCEALGPTGGLSSPSLYLIPLVATEVIHVLNVILQRKLPN
jgi:hypothetical protein